MNSKIQFAAIGIVGALVSFGEAVEVPADSLETLGMVKISKTNAVNNEIVLGIPYMKSPSGDTNTVSSLLVAGYGEKWLIPGILSNGDTIRVWNAAKPSERGYDMWQTLSSTAAGSVGSNRWVAVRDIARECPAEATVYQVNRGTALWFADNTGDTNDLVQAGLVKPGAESSVAAGTSSAPVKTLLINPYYTAINAVDALNTGAKTGDQLALVAGTSRFEYKEGEGWGTWQKTIKKKIGSIIIYGPDVFVPTNNIPVAAGTAFWYISKGGSPTVSWDAL